MPGVHVVDHDTLNSSRYGCRYRREVVMPSNIDVHNSVIVIADPRPFELCLSTRLDLSDDSAHWNHRACNMDRGRSHSNPPGPDLMNSEKVDYLREID